jgi:hypothetical protein
MPGVLVSTAALTSLPRIGATMSAAGSASISWAVRPRRLICRRL